MRRFLLGVAMAVVATSQAASPAAIPTVRNAIEMVRIQNNVAVSGAVAAISADGRQAAFVTFHGDLERNVNVYDLNVVGLDVRGGTRRPEVVTTREYVGDPLDQSASPFSRVRFVGRGGKLAFLGRDAAGVSQAFVVDMATHETRQLTHHSTHVRDFVLDSAGELTAYVAIAQPIDRTAALLSDDGVFLWDYALFPRRLPFISSAAVLLRSRGASAIREYFVVDSDNGPRRFFDSGRSRYTMPAELQDPKHATSPNISFADDSTLLVIGAFVGDSSGTRALLYPYGRADHPMRAERYEYYRSTEPNLSMKYAAAPIGIVDTRTGTTELLLDAPSPSIYLEGGPPLWSQDGLSVIAFTLLPDAPSEPPQWVEVDIATRHITRLGLMKEWRPIGWAAKGHALVLSHRDREFATMEKTGGRWRQLVHARAVVGLNPDYPAAVDGNVIVGVRDGLTTAPELVLQDQATPTNTVLTDLNPQLRELRFGVVESVRWRDEKSNAADGFLIRPVDYQPGVRYPLVILLDDSTLRKQGEPFLFDGVMQSSGHAAQMLAAQGFMVLYAREPPLSDVIQTAEEGLRMRRHIEAAVAKLDREGLIDPLRIGVAGWSRAGYYVDYLQMHSSIRFAAASSIDGGGLDYADRMRPYTDAELQQISSPKLFEAHGTVSLAAILAPMADRMMALGRPAEILYFDTASHSATRPLHRLRSLGTHIDWWRFWLKGEEDSDPGKAGQYAQWRTLRMMRDALRTGRREESMGYEPTIARVR